MKYLCVNITNVIHVQDLYEENYKTWMKGIEESLKIMDSYPMLYGEDPMFILRRIYFFQDVTSSQVIL